MKSKFCTLIYLVIGVFLFVLFAGITVDFIQADGDNAVYLPSIFKNHHNHPPFVPSNPSPADNAIDQSPAVILQWAGGDPDGNAVTYDVYLTTHPNSPGDLVSDDQAGITYDPGSLYFFTDYYWQIIATDEYSSTTSGPIWHFTTGGSEIPASGIITVTVPAGEFSMGCDPDHNDGKDCINDEGEETDEVPLHTVELSAYSIDKYEVTNTQYAVFLNNHGSNDCKGHDCVDLDSEDIHIMKQDDEYVVEEGYEDHPVIVVTWYGAHTYCSAGGKRLPTEAEWEKAARGESIQAFPWGDWAPDCTYANYDNHGFCVGDTAPVGSYPLGASPYDAMDMAGNVWEWISDWYDFDYYSTYPEYAWPIDPTGPESGLYKGVRGGGWLCIESGLRVANRHYYHPSVSGYSIGFRCVDTVDDR